MSDVRNDARDDRSIQIDPDTCRSILADEIPGKWEWCEGAFELDGPAGLEVRVRIELNEETDRWTIEPTINGDGPGRSLAPRLGLHGTLETVAERLRGKVLEALDETHREVNAFRGRLLDRQEGDSTDERHMEPFSRAEIINRLAVCNPDADERFDIIDVALSGEMGGGFPSGSAGLVLALDLLDSPDKLDDATAEHIGPRLRAVAADLEETGRQLEARGRELAG
jgi:hypothetical protein